MVDLHDTHTLKRKISPANAYSLNDKHHEFAHLDVRDVEHLLRYRTLSETRIEFKFCVDEKRKYIDCSIL